MPRAEQPRKIYCPECRTQMTPLIRKKRETYSVRGKDTSIIADVPVCTSCGAEIFDEELDSKNLERAYSKYRKKYGILSSDEIRRIRLMYDLGQRTFARLLGFGDVTIHRYEHGSVPDRAHSQILRSVTDPSQMLDILERTEATLPSGLKPRLRNRIRGLLEHHLSPTLRDCIEAKLGRREPDEVSGFRRFDL